MTRRTSWAGLLLLLMFVANEVAAQTSRPSRRSTSTSKKATPVKRKTEGPAVRRAWGLRWHDDVAHAVKEARGPKTIRSMNGKKNGKGNGKRKQKNRNVRKKAKSKRRSILWVRMLGELDGKT